MEMSFKLLSEYIVSAVLYLHNPLADPGPCLDVSFFFPASKMWIIVH